MNILPISQQNQSNTSFSGKIKIFGGYSKALAEQIYNSDLNTLTKNHDVLVIANNKSVKFSDLHHSTGDRLYQLRVLLTKENSKFQKIMTFLGAYFGKPLTKFYHREQTTIDSLYDEHMTNLINNLTK